ncbi:DUF3667 domain-containing protein [uncultured Polaribacter sp.]|uniref:DUF3667 domain-containing protein n=1 Tax=uncultured Polaribacter sp. TaxID=174711 RepID=UPI00261C4E98|nr:DUF3667 domain-containing protein [uncultured Polaribacter sp.]
MGNENFCPDCGQANKGDKITFKSFVYEMFNGFFNFEAKFWNTIIPLLTKPGKVSKDYITGKRQRYSNPFRFYLTVSILFFLILGFSKSLDKFKELKNGNTEDEVTQVDNNNLPKTDLDSLETRISKQLNKPWIPLDSVQKKKIIADALEKAKDTTQVINTDALNVSFGGDTRLDKFVTFQKKYPDIPIDDALDSLRYEKTLINRFLYNRGKVANLVITKKASREQFLNQLLSYGSIALFIFLPIFTLFLKLFYIGGKLTYVDHLVFVFHTQTVFFMLLSIYYLIDLFGIDPQLWIFAILFLVYLFLAIRKFYHQGIFKTLLKFVLLNFVYITISSIGVTIVLLLSFALY